MKTVLINTLIILLLFGCAQNGPKRSETAYIDNSQVQEAGVQLAILERARTLRKTHPQLFGEAKGVLVTEVVPGSQGEEAGLKSGDILLTYDNKPLNSVEHLIELTGKYSENDEIVMLTYLRNRELYNLILRGGRIGIHVVSIIPSQAESLTKQLQLLNKKGTEATSQYRLKEALQLYQQGLQIANDMDIQEWVAEFKIKLGTVYTKLSQYPKAMDYFQQVLLIARKKANPALEANSLNNLGIVYRKQGRFALALDHYQQSLAIKSEIQDAKGKMSSLTNLGNVFSEDLNQYAQALDYYQKSLVISREIGNPEAEAKNLNGLGYVYYMLGQYSQALDYFKESLTISRKIGNPIDEVDSLNKLGGVHRSLAQYKQALDFYQQSLAIAQRVEHHSGKFRNLSNIGLVYFDLGQYQQALKSFQKALAFSREINDRKSEAFRLNHLGRVYLHLGQYQQAIDHFRHSLEISREFGYRDVEWMGLINLGIVYYQLGQNHQALDYSKKSLAISQEIGIPYGEANSLISLGTVYGKLEQYKQALDVYYKAMNILVQVKDPESHWRVWYGISKLLYQLNQIHSAILAGKQAINNLQSIRANNISLEKDLQVSYIEGKLEAYHALAEMLIEQSRLAEAEQVMAMLKEEEYFDFIRRDGKDDMRTTQTGYTQVESGIVKQIYQFNDLLVSLGKENEKLGKLRQIDEQAKARLAEVEKELEQAQDGFLNLLSSLQDYFKQAGSDKALEFGERQLAQLERQQNLLRVHEAVIITTVATKDKLHLILTTPEVQLARESALTERDLNDLIKRFRNALKHPGSDPVPLAQELYSYLVKPLEKDLQQAQTKTLMWSLDGALRYIPLATLHDGQQYLIEKYGLSLYTAAAQNNLHENNVSAWRAAGLGVSQAHPGFVALPSVPNELRNIIRQNENDQIGVLPGEIHLDQAFNRESFKSVIRAGYPVLHIASHFKLQPGNGSLSTLLLGDGDLLSLDEFQRQAAFKLHGVDLLTLSACDTAVGDKGAGGEVESFAVMAQLRGANGVLASLWRVEDESTGLLMKRLYRLRSENTQLSKAEALRQAQVAMLNGNLQAQESGHDFRHPYFWAPFVMMGNWL